jgi:hypothetical protein
MLSIFLHEPIDSVNAKHEKGTTRGHLLVKFRNKLLEITKNKETAIFGPCRLAHRVALMPANNQSAFYQFENSSFNDCENTYPDFVALGSFPTGCLSSQPSIIGWLIPSLNPKLNIKVSLTRKSSLAFNKYLLFFPFHRAWANVPFSDQGQFDSRVLTEDIGVWVESFSLLG